MRLALLLVALVTVVSGAPLLDQDRRSLIDIVEKVEEVIGEITNVLTPSGKRTPNQLQLMSHFDLHDHPIKYSRKDLADIVKKIEELFLEAVHENNGRHNSVNHIQIIG
ncbi:uncharacterized protein LOC101846831 [Aplysia californica]|uniref:Uncharacterized protein LOC101846831 n=1 Tax=Aplysia californica TaxID=6500 RepID=A0ABM0JXK1_APLCA|nr:uncharacterized protein LOC101846831 [Aplysia californica]